MLHYRALLLTLSVRAPAARAGDIVRGTLAVMVSRHRERGRRTDAEHFAGSGGVGGRTWSPDAVRTVIVATWSAADVSERRTLATLR